MPSSLVLSWPERYPLCCRYCTKPLILFLLPDWLFEDSMWLSLIIYPGFFPTKSQRDPSPQWAYVLPSCFHHDSSLLVWENTTASKWPGYILICFVVKFLKDVGPTLILSLAADSHSWNWFPGQSWRLLLTTRFAPRIWRRGSWHRGSMSGLD